MTLLAMADTRNSAEYAFTHVSAIACTTKSEDTCLTPCDSLTRPTLAGRLLGPGSSVFCRARTS